MTNTIKVLLADDHQIVTDGLRSVLEKEADLEVVGIARNGKEVLQQLEAGRADIAVLDIEMPEMDGIEATRHIKERFPEVKVLILSMYNSKDFVQRALEEGANGYILKEKSKEALVGAIHTVHSGSRYIPPNLLDFFIPGKKKQTKDKAIRLTEREQMVLEKIAEGKTASEIGAELDIKESTAQAHTRNLRRKFKVRNLVELVRKGVKLEFIKL